MRMRRRLSGDDPVDQDAEPLDLGADQVAGPQARASARADPGRRPGGDHVTWLQRHGPAGRGEQTGDVADHVRGARVLLELVVDPQADTQYPATCASARSGGTSRPPTPTTAASSASQSSSAASGPSTGTSSNGPMTAVVGGLRKKNGVQSAVGGSMPISATCRR